MTSQESVAPNLTARTPGRTDSLLGLFAEAALAGVVEFFEGFGFDLPDALTDHGPRCSIRYRLNRRRSRA